MLRIVRKNQDREQQLVDQLLEERDRLVRVLAEQVEYLRGQLHAPTATVGMALAPSHEFVEHGERPDIELIPAFGGDDRDELEAMRQANVITEEEYQKSLATLMSGANIIE